ncbi:MAG: hypothetical protein AABW51_00570 [Nanoarchaeota archaeon]
MKRAIILTGREGNSEFYSLLLELNSNAVFYTHRFKEGNHQAFLDEVASDFAEKIAEYNKSGILEVGRLNGYNIIDGKPIEVDKIDTTSFERRLEKLLKNLKGVTAVENIASLNN